MNTELLKSKLLEAAFNGSLTHADTSKWEETTIGGIFAHNTGKALKKDNTDGVLRPYITTSNLYWDRFDMDVVKQMYFKDNELEKFTIQKGDLLICEGGDIGRSAIWNYDYSICFQNHVHRLRPKKEACVRFYYYIMLYYKWTNRIKGRGIGLEGFSSGVLDKLQVPYPPLAEQERIVSALEEGFAAIDAIAEAKANLSNTAEMLRSKILQAAFDGTLTGEDFTKCLVQLGNVCDIARGGSPRPIKQYITTAANGVNWIKIGDTEKGGKYINSCKEKIKPEGVKRSREVHKGDFLLTNSMSFGRPYITNIDGCIHDGWLVISPHDNTFDKDFLFYLLSSSYVYAQFCDKATGSTVSNLNIDRVKATSVPMPSISEQQRIVAKIEELFAEIDKLTK